MAFEKYSTKRLKQYQKILIGTMTFGLVAIFLTLGVSLYYDSDSNKNNLIYFVPTIAPLVVFIPLIFASLLNQEIKKRN